MKKNNLKANSKKWTPTLMDVGWIALPSVIIDQQAELGLEPIDINIILHLAKYWWSEDNPPYPTKKTLADKMNRHPSTIQKRIARLEKSGLIERVKRTDPDKKSQLSNIYKLDGLIKRVTPYAEEAIKLKKKHQQERREANKVNDM